MPDFSKKKSTKRRRESTEASNPIITDPRFANIQTDPRYRLPSKRHTQVQLDKRFLRMLRDDEFARSAAVDRYGRSLPKDSGRKQLERFYRFQEEGEDDAVDDDVEVEEELGRVKKTYDPVREGGFSSSSDDESSEEDQIEEDEAEIEFPDQQQADVPMGEISSRIAVVNLDWDNIRAEDLMAVFSSFVPSNGHILKVSIFPSEFGRERMEREETEGPPKEMFLSNPLDDEASEPEESQDEEEEMKESMIKEDKGEEFDSARLRRYQLDRLRYFYAVLTCSSPAVAKAIYDAVDGTEYLTTANFFDLRFVLDDTDFSDDKARDECERIPDGYKPNDFVTDALQHSKVKLTWDADDAVRRDAQAKAFRGGRKEIDENDLKAYLGSDGSDEDEPEVTGGPEEAISAPSLSKKEAERQRMRTLLGLANVSTRKAKSTLPVGDMQITFSSGLSGVPAKGSMFENEPQQEETTVQRYVRKEKERKQRRKEKMKSANGGLNVTENGKQPSAPNTENAEKSVDLGFEDPFFVTPENDKAASSTRRREEKLKKREQRATEEAASSAKRAELALLMVEDNNMGVRHFDMRDIERAEKKARKGSKKRKGVGKQDETPRDDFRVDVEDPRFQQLFESHEFAIDPTNPRFKGTDGMNKLLEESRKRRRKDEADAMDAQLAEKKWKQRKGNGVEGKTKMGRVRKA